MPRRPRIHLDKVPLHEIIKGACASTNWQVIVGGWGDIILIRYADDSVLGFPYENEARRFLAEMHERVAKFGLALHPEKTRLRVRALAVWPSCICLIRDGCILTRQSVSRHDPRQEPYAVMPLVRICAGGATGIPTATEEFRADHPQ